MPAPDVVLTVATDVDTRTATQQFVKFQRDVMRQLQRVTQAVQATGTANSKVSQKAQEDADEWSKGLKGLTKYYQDEIGKINALQTALSKAEKARQTGDEASRKAAERRAKAIKKELDEQKKSLKTKAVTTTFDSDAMGKEATAALGQAADTFKGTISSFFSKDLKGVILGGGGLVKHLSKAAAKGLAAGGDKLSGMGTAMGRKGAARGGGMGGSMQALGKGLKGLGSLGKSLGPVVSSLAKLGPLLGIVGAGIAGLVKLFIDAEAQAKEFQKTVLQSASTSEYLAAAGGDVDVAFANLSDDMKSVRDAAYSLDNLGWGISAEQHKAVLNALTQEGVTLHSMRKEAELAGKSMGQFTAQLTHVSVAYSRNFGVSLQEINNFQAEMMTEMGMSLDSTQMAFSQMTRAAGESGIAANKFFSIIRGVSQDLSLYNVRMGSAVKLLKMLGKVMNPREAGKFMQTAMQGMKQMGQDERLKVALLAGGKGKEIVKKDLENRRNDLYQRIAKAIGGQADDIQKRLSDPKQAKALWQEVQKKAEGKAGALRGAALELQIDTTAAKKGVYGQAFAMENLGAGATLDMMTAAIGRFGGGGSLIEGAGSLGMTKMAEMLGVNTQQLRGMMKLEVAVREQKDALLDQGKKELAAATTEKEKAAAQEKIRIAQEGTTQDILDTLSEEEQNTLKEETKSQLDFAKEQGKLTQTLTEQLQVIIDFLMNQLYNVLIDIWDTLSNIPGLGGDKTARKAKIAAARGGGGMGSEVARATAEAVQKAGDKGGVDVRAVVGGTKAFQRMLTALSSTVDVTGTEKKKTQLDLVESRLKEGRGPGQSEEEWAKMSKQLGIRADELKSVIAAEEKIAEERYVAQRILDKEIKQQGSEGGLSAGRAIYAAVGRDPETSKKVRAVQESMSMGTSFSGALEGAGFNPKEMGEIMSKAMHWFTSDEQLAGGAAEFESVMKAQDEAAAAAAEEAQKTSANTEEAARAAKSHYKDAKSPNTLYYKFPNNWLNGPYKKAIEEAVLDALRVALFEYFMYKDLDKESVVKTMKAEGWDPKDWAGVMSELPKSGVTPEESMPSLKGAAGGEGDGENLVSKMPGHQHGGVVSRISKEGMAIFRTPPGEGMTAIRAGERIVPAYAGGGAAGGGAAAGGAPTHVIISVSPEAQRLIQTEVQYGINEHERRKRTAG